jgi:hypothetical protein
MMRLAEVGTLKNTDLIAARLLGKGTFESFVSSVAAYWIYRVRSSIAHSRVGEFLFLEADEQFITDFAEPLLLDVVMQVFENPKLKVLTAV